MVNNRQIEPKIIYIMLLLEDHCSAKSNSTSTTKLVFALEKPYSLIMINYSHWQSINFLNNNAQDHIKRHVAF